MCMIERNGEREGYFGGGGWKVKEMVKLKEMVRGGEDEGKREENGVRLRL